MTSSLPAYRDNRAGHRKCAACGLVNFAGSAACRRCGSPLAEHESLEAPAGDATARHRIRRRVVWLAAVTVAVVFAWSRSLLLTSEPADPNQRQTVMRAVAILQHAGFSKEVLMLRHFANYRVTDNWWNLYLGHREAYAATNFPLGVMTLYPPFFKNAEDDTERAAILLHEAQHLWGYGEEAALEYVWREKARLGWTADRYGETRVWKNVREWTAADVPALFQCGAQQRSDCVK